MRVLVYDPYRPDGAGCTSASIALARSMISCGNRSFSVHGSLTSEMRHDESPHALTAAARALGVVNTSRGPTIDGNVRCSMRSNRTVAYAALDVVEPRTAGRRTQLQKHPRILPSPHSAFYSVEGFQEMRDKGAMEARRILTGEAVRNPVNLHCLTNAKATLPKIA
ncbi:MAG: NAD(P)-dependent oxidoreductase [Gemmataceae bacterium]